MGDAAMPIGTIKKFVVEKAFGFIGQDDGSPDVFAPARTLDGDKNNVREGMKVEYQPKPDDRTGKSMASSWKLLEDPANFSAPAPAYGGAPAYGQYGAYGGAPVDNRYSPYGGAPAPVATLTPGLPPGWESAMDPSTGNP